jgi:hypothetical protein
MHHKIKISPAHIEMIKSGILPFWIDDALKHDIQVAHFIDFESNESCTTVRTQATYVTNRHQHYNHIVIGLKLVEKLTDEELASYAYTSPVLHAQLEQPKHQQQRCADKEDMKRKFQILKKLERYEKDNGDKIYRPSVSIHIDQLNIELSEIEARFFDISNGVKE